MYDTIKLLEENDLLDRCLRDGVISATLICHKSIYETYLKEKTKGYKTVQAVINTCIATGTPESTIYKVIKKMKS